MFCEIVLPNKEDGVILWKAEDLRWLYLTTISHRVLKVLMEHSLPAAGGGRLNSEGKVCMHITTHANTVVVFFGQGEIKVVHTHKNNLRLHRSDTRLLSIWIILSLSTTDVQCLYDWCPKLAEQDKIVTQCIKPYKHAESKLAHNGKGYYQDEGAVRWRGK